MAFRCKNCGGNILFDIDTQAMRCQHCDSVFPPEAYQVRDYGVQSNLPEAKMPLFTCGGCGAELQGTEESQVGFCPYCGGQSLLQTGWGGGRMTEYVLPFQVSRARCADLFRDNAKSIRYLPRELKNPEHLENITGIYMPYYTYDVQMGQSHITGTKTVEHHANYDIVNTYQIDAAVEGGACVVPFDASRYLDDEIAARTLPFDLRRQRPFQAAYLSGFYADASTVSARTYYNDAAEQASKDMVAAVADQMRIGDGITVDTNGSHVDARTVGAHTALFPMWFLTWRKGDRVAYAVVNGESGKVVSDLPVDMSAFALGCAAIAAVLFALLELLFQPTPLITSVISIIAGVLMASSVRGSTKQVFERETHANDKGWLAGTAPQPAQAGETPNRKKRKGPKTNIPIALPVFFGTIVAYFVIPGLTMSWDQLIAAASVIVLVFELRSVAKWQKSIPEKLPLISILLILLSVVLNAAIVFISPVNDFWYYLGDAAGILILLAASVAMMRLYNIGTTRPLPKLFGRNEVS